MSFLGFGKAPTVDVILDPKEAGKSQDKTSASGSFVNIPIYYDGENVSGHVLVLLNGSSKFEHFGIQVELIGQLLVNGERQNFICMQRELANPGTLTQNAKFSFEFLNVEKRFETYSGKHAKLRYFVRATINKRISSITKEMDFIVHSLAHYPDLPNRSVSMEVGIHESLVIELEYDKQRYHLKDVIVGKVFFLQVRVKVVKMEIQIIRQETTVGVSGSNTCDNEVAVRHEIMDGGPARGESIPFRMFLAGYDLLPTMRDVNKRFSVINFINLVLVDEDGRRYYKQQEIFLYRRLDPRKLKKSPIASPALIQQVQSMRLLDSPSTHNGQQPEQKEEEEEEPSTDAVPPADE